MNASPQQAKSRLDALPGWLDLPSSSSVTPPAVTTAAELPIGDLAWPDFERLCLQLARHESDVVGARLYGTAGQEQQGIDLYARLAGVNGYRVYQCKHVSDFGPSLIREAVDLFLEGDWAGRASELVLCTRDGLRTTQRIEEFERQRERLSECGIRFDVWAKEDISLIDSAAAHFLYMISSVAHGSSDSAS